MGRFIILFVIIVIVVIIITALVISVVLVNDAIYARPCITWAVSLMHLIYWHHSFEKLCLFILSISVSKGRIWNQVFLQLMSKLLLSLNILFFITGILIYLQFSFVSWWKIAAHLSILLNQISCSSITFLIFNRWKASKSCTAWCNFLKSLFLVGIFTFCSNMRWFRWHYFNTFWITFL